MIRAHFPHRPAGLALCLLVLSTTAGCAHFHNAEVRAEQRREAAQPTAPALAEARPQTPSAPAPSAPPAPVAAAPVPPTPAPVAAPAAIPPPAPAAPTAPMPEVAAPAPPPPPVAAPSAPVPAPAPRQAEQTPPAPAPEAPVAPPPAPSPVPAPPPIAAAVTAPATDSAIIIFANTPGAHCGTCDTIKLSVAPSGQVLIERGYWASADHSNWHYKRSRAEVSPARAAAFAARLSDARPAGIQSIGSGCPAPAAGAGGLAIEWIEADRHDRLTVSFGCPSGNSGDMAERLRHAPDLLGLHQLAFP